MKTLDVITSLENGEGNEIKSLQALINSGAAWTFSGSTGRACMDAIRAGLCALGPKGHRDAYGNYVPSRFEVKPGTKGSKEFVEDHGNEIQEGELC